MVSILFPLQCVNSSRPVNVCMYETVNEAISGLDNGFSAVWYFGLIQSKDTAPPAWGFPLYRWDYRETMGSLHWEFLYWYDDIIILNHLLGLIMLTEVGSRCFITKLTAWMTQKYFIRNWLCHIINSLIPLFYIFMFIVKQIDFTYAVTCVKIYYMHRICELWFKIKTKFWVE